MPLSIAESLSAISASAAKLNTLAAQATSQIKALDKFLAENPICIEVIGGSIGHDHSVGYGRADDGKWRLVLLDCSASNSKKKALVNVSRESRIAAMPHLPGLLEKIAEEGQNLAAAATMDGAKVEKVVHEITQATLTPLARRIILPTIDTPA